MARLFRLPWVSRERYEEMRAELEKRCTETRESLEKRCSELEAERNRLVSEISEERKKLIDNYTLLSFGRGIYTQEPEKPKPTEEPELRPTPEQQSVDDVREAIQATGSRDVRTIAAWIERRNFERARAKELIRNKEPNIGSALMEEAEQEGIAAAQQQQATEA